MRHPLDSARDRLNRANENIRNLNGEVSQFLTTFPRIKAKGLNPRFTNEDGNAFEILRQEALKGNAIPRFSVIAGEIIHHLRSAFDNLIWQLSAVESRTKFAPQIEFPVCASEPECIIDSKGKVKHSSYCRKVQGVGSITALARIEGLQPYKRGNLHDSPLYLIHILDKFDKHRALVDVTPRVATQLWGHVLQPMRTKRDTASGGWIFIGPASPPKVEVYTEIAPQVGFAEINGWKTNIPLVPLLEDFSRFTRDSIESFAGEFD